MSKHYAKAKKEHWIDRAIATHNFHVEQISLDSQWRMEDTARSLGRSLGSVSQDIEIARYLKTHENRIRRCDLRVAALELIKELKDDMKRHII